MTLVLPITLRLKVDMSARPSIPYIHKELLHHNHLPCVHKAVALNPVHV